MFAFLPPRPARGGERVSHRPRARPRSGLPAAGAGCFLHPFAVLWRGARVCALASLDDKQGQEPLPCCFSCALIWASAKVPRWRPDPEGGPQRRQRARVMHRRLVANDGNQMSCLQTSAAVQLGASPCWGGLSFPGAATRRRGEGPAPPPAQPLLPLHSLSSHPAGSGKGGGWCPGGGRRAARLPAGLCHRPNSHATLFDGSLVAL